MIVWLSNMGHTSIKMRKNSIWINIITTIAVQGFLFYFLGEFTVSGLWNNEKELICIATFCLLLSISIHLIFATKEKVNRQYIFYFIICLFGFILFLFLIFLNYMTIGIHIFSFNDLTSGDGLLYMIVQVIYLACLGMLHLISFVFILVKNKIRNTRGTQGDNSVVLTIKK